MKNIYIHKKSGLEYLVLRYDIINCTNENSDQIMVMYTKNTNEDFIYVREITEFNEKFERIQKWRSIV